MSREQKLFKNTIVLAIGTFVPKLTALVTLPLLTGHLNTQDYGSYDLIMTLAALILPIGTLQIQTAAFRFLIDKRKSDKYITEIISGILAFSVPISVVILACLFAFIPISGVLEKLIICIYFFADMLLNTARQITRGLSKNLSYSISTIISAVGNVLFALVLVAVFDMGLNGAVISMTLADISAFVFLMFKSGLWKHIDFSKVNKKSLIHMISYSWPMVPNSLGLWVMSASDRLVISAVMGVSANAIYAVANKIPQLLTTAQSTFTMAWQESASLAADDTDKGEYYSRMFGTMYNFYVGCFGALIGFTPILFKVLIKGNYDAAYYQMPILFFGVFFNCLTAYLGGIYIAHKRTKSVGVTTVAAAVTNLIIDVMFVHKIGIYAASVSTFVSYFLLFLFRMADVQKIVHLKISYKQVVGLLLILIAESGLCYLRVPALDGFNLVFGCGMFIVLNHSMVMQIVKTVLKR